MRMMMMSLRLRRSLRSVKKKKTQDQEDACSQSDKDEFKDCIEQDSLEGSCNETKDKDDKTLEFVDDEEWEALANETLNGTVEEIDVLEPVKIDIRLDDVALAKNYQELHDEKIEIHLTKEVVSSVVTSAIDNHGTLLRPEFVSNSPQ